MWFHLWVWVLMRPFCPVALPFAWYQHSRQPLPAFCLSCLLPDFARPSLWSCGDSAPDLLFGWGSPCDSTCLLGFGPLDLPEVKALFPPIWILDSDLLWVSVLESLIPGLLRELWLRYSDLCNLVFCVILIITSGFIPVSVVCHIAMLFCCSVSWGFEKDFFGWIKTFFHSHIQKIFVEEKLDFL